MKKTHKKIAAAVFSLTFTMLMTSAVFAVEGSGTKRYPYLITTEDELKQIGEELDASAYYSLQNDITLTSPNWIPIAKRAEGFKGNFEGNGHAIIGLKLKNTRDDRQGLFYDLDNCTVSNLRIEEVDIEAPSYVGALTGYVGSSSVITNCSSSGVIYSENGQYIGGLVGENNGKIIGSSSKCTIQGSAVSMVGGVLGRNYGNIENSFFNGAINDIDGEYIGGLVGAGSGDVVSCYAITDISADANYVGGLCGGAGNISKSFFDGNITVESRGLKGNCVGGLTGYGVGEVDQCYTSGKVVSDGKEVRAIVAYNPVNVRNSYSLMSVENGTEEVFSCGHDEYYWKYSSQENCYYAGYAPKATSVFGGSEKSYFDSQVLGASIQDNSSAKTSELKDINSSIYFYWDMKDIWNIDPAINNGYPYLRNVVVPKVEVTGISITSGSQVLRPGAERQLAAEVSPAGAQTNIKWSSSDPSVVTVDANGKITAAAEGTAVITAETEEKGYTATCSVTVSNNFILGDLDGDGKITAADSAMVLQKALVSTYKFPIE